MIIEWKNLNPYEQDAIADAYGFTAIEYHRGISAEESIVAILNLNRMGLLDVYADGDNGDYQATVTALGERVYRGEAVEVNAPFARVASQAAKSSVTAFPVSDDGTVSVSAKAYHDLERRIADLEAQAVNDARTIEGLSAQIVHAQMELAAALGHEEADYHANLGDLADEVAQLRQQVDFLIRGSGTFKSEIGKEG